MENYNEALAVLLARIFLGVLFIIQGYDKVFRVGLNNVSATFKYEVKIQGIPDLIYKCVAFLSSYAELIGGFLLLLGLVRYWALTALGVDLIIVAIGMGLIKPVWNMDIVFPRLVLLLFLLLAPACWDVFSIDNLLAFK